MKSARIPWNRWLIIVLLSPLILLGLVFHSLGKGADALFEQIATVLDLLAPVDWRDQ